MARTTKTVYTSDLTGEEIVSPAKVQLTVNGTVYLADVDADEEFTKLVMEKGAKRKTRKPRAKKEETPVEEELPI